MTHRLLVFFPSYPALQAALDGWRLSPIMGRLEAYKAVVVEPRQSGDLKVRGGETSLRSDSVYRPV
jgi:hypothetical protein